MRAHHPFVGPGGSGKTPDSWAHDKAANITPKADTNHQISRIRFFLIVVTDGQISCARLVVSGIGHKRTFSILELEITFS